MNLEEYLNHIKRIIKEYNGNLADFEDYKLNLEEELSDFLTENNYQDNRVEGEQDFVSNLEAPKEIAKVIIDKELKITLEYRLRFDLIIGNIMTIFFIILSVFQYRDIVYIFEPEEHIYYFFRLGSYYLFYVIWLIIYAIVMRKSFVYLANNKKLWVNPKQTHFLEIGITTFIATNLGFFNLFLIRFLLDLNVIYFLSISFVFYIYLGLPLTVLTIFIHYTEKYTVKINKNQDINLEKSESSSLLQFSMIMAFIVSIYIVLDKIVFYSRLSWYDLLANPINIVLLLPTVFLIFYKFLPVNPNIMQKITSNTKELIATIIIFLLATVTVSIGTDFIIYIFNKENNAFSTYFLEMLLTYNYFPIITIYLLYFLLVFYKSNIRKTKNEF
ncbi:MAG: hypothetical protein ACXACX_05535 [Candidatus Hodarchaeales archaeon]|jgi:hypothetical protein